MKDTFDVHAWNIKRYLNELDINKQGGEDDIDQEDVAGSLNVTHGGDDPTIGAEEEAGVIGDRVEENKSYLNSLASKLSSEYPDLNFYVRDEPYFDRIDVIGSERDKLIFGDKFHGKEFGEYEVFHTDDDDRGEIVRIVKSDSIMRSKTESLEAVEETVKFIMEDLEGYSNYFPDGKTTGLTSDEMSTILMQIVKDIEESGNQLNEKLCKKGEAYRKRRMAAGEKSSAYLSGRAVKVCNGTMSGKKKKKTNEQEEKSNKVAEAALILPRGKKVVLQAEEEDYKRGLIVELTNEGGYKINYWYGDDVKIYPAEVEVDGKSIKDDANEVYIKFHPELKKDD